MTQRARVRMLIQSVIDGGIGVAMFLAAYWLRFETELIPAPKGQPPLDSHLQLAPFVGLLLPFGLWLQGAYRHERIRSRIDDFFAVLIGGLIAVVLGLAQNVDEIGRPLCPCRFYPDKKEEVQHRTWVCACDDMQIYKYCH